MISVQEAEELIFSHLPLSSIETCSIENLKEHVIREDLYADRPLPPYDRVAFDGIAFLYSAFEQGLRSFPIKAIHYAGDPTIELSDPKTCFEVMTGSILPKGCDCVVGYEEIEIREGVAYLSEGISPKERQNIHLRGSDFKKGDLIVSKGMKLLSFHWAVAASVGKAKVIIAKPPKVAVITTGDELVEVEQIPLEHQVRKSNIYSIISGLRSLGVKEITSFEANDQQDQLKRVAEEALKENDLIIFSGGTSKGKRDYLPKVLEVLQVEKIFHKVRQRPGKPLWFGKGERGQLVFGLPGNPVAAIISLHRFILPALKRILGQKTQATRPFAKLAREVFCKQDMTTFLPVGIEYTQEGMIIAHPIQMNGSGDFGSLIKSDGFIEITDSQNRAAALHFWNF